MTNYQTDEKVKVVTFVDTIIQDFTMVVEMVDATVAGMAVFGRFNYVEFTLRAVQLHICLNKLLKMFRFGIKILFFVNP